MTKITSSLFVVTLLALGLDVASAQAQYVRTCVSANGNDANTCHCTQPCRTFQRAHDQTLPDGELTVLDPGGYGPVTITKSISIVNDGVGEASIQVFGPATGITINAAAGAGYVNLRGITIQGVGGGGGEGLRFNSGFALTVTNCVIRNHTGRGMSLIPVVNSKATITISHTLIGDNGSHGIILAPSGSGTVRAVFSRVESYNNTNRGILLDGTSSSGVLEATVVDSVAANNLDRGIQLLTFSAAGANSLMVIRSVSAGNLVGIGVNASPGTATVRVGQSTVTNNTVSTQVSGAGVLRSYGDNNIDGNGDAPEPAPTTIAKK